MKCDELMKGLLMQARKIDDVNLDAEFTPGLKQVIILVQSPRIKLKKKQM